MKHRGPDSWLLQPLSAEVVELNDVLFNDGLMDEAIGRSETFEANTLCTAESDVSRIGSAISSDADDVGM